MDLKTLMGYSVKELRKMCADLSIAKSGTKAVMSERILEHLAGQPGETDFLSTENNRDETGFAEQGTLEELDLIHGTFAVSPTTLEILEVLNFTRRWRYSFKSYSPADHYLIAALMPAKELVRAIIDARETVSMSRESPGENLERLTNFVKEYAQDDAEIVPELESLFANFDVAAVIIKRASEEVDEAATRHDPAMCASRLACEVAIIESAVNDFIQGWIRISLRPERALYPDDFKPEERKLIRKFIGIWMTRNLGEVTGRLDERKLRQAVEAIRIDDEFPIEKARDTIIIQQILKDKLQRRLQSNRSRSATSANVDEERSGSRKRTRSVLGSDYEDDDTARDDQESAERSRARNLPRRSVQIISSDEDE